MMRSKRNRTQPHKAQAMSVLPDLEGTLFDPAEPPPLELLDAWLADAEAFVRTQWERDIDAKKKSPT